MAGWRHGFLAFAVLCCLVTGFRTTPAHVRAQAESDPPTAETETEPNAPPEIGAEAEPTEAVTEPYSAPELSPESSPESSPEPTPVSETPTLEGLPTEPTTTESPPADTPAPTETLSPTEPVMAASAFTGGDLQSLDFGAAAAGDVLIETHAVSPEASGVTPGATLDYSFTVGCLWSDCLDVVVRNVIPGDLQYVSVSPTDLVTVSSEDGNTQVFAFNRALERSEFITLTVRVEYPADSQMAYETPLVNHAEVSSSNDSDPSNNQADAPTVYARPPQNLTFTKSVVGTGAVNGTTTYTLNVNNGSVLAVENTLIIDLLPMEVDCGTFAGGSGGDIVSTQPTAATCITSGRYTSPSGAFYQNNTGRAVVIWDVGTVPSGTSSYQLTVIYSSEDSFSTASTIVNDAYFRGQRPHYSAPYDELNREARATHGLAETSYSVTVENAVAATYPGRNANGEQVRGLLVGEDADYVATIRNTGNAPLSNLVLTNTLPSEFDLEQLSLAFPTALSSPITITTEADMGSGWETVSSVTASDGTGVITPTPPEGQHVRRIRLVLSQLPAGAQGTLSVDGAILATRWADDPNGVNGSPVEADHRVENCVAASAQTPQGERSQSSCANTAVVNALPIGTFTKTGPASETYPGGYADFAISYAIETNADVDSVEIVDTLPDGMTFVEITGLTGIPADRITASAVVMDSRDVVTFRIDMYDGAIPTDVGPTTRRIDYRVAVRDNVALDTYENLACLQSIGPSDLFLDSSNPNNSLVGACREASVTVAEARFAVGTKAVQGSEDDDFSSTGQGGRGTTADYRLQWLNDTNGAMRGLTLIDILPATGDTHVLSDTARGSDWTAAFDSLLAVTDTHGTPIDPSLYTVEYSASSNPCRGELTEAGGAWPADCSDDWSTTAPADARALRIDFGAHSFAAATGVVVTYRVQIPADVGSATTAYNSFAWRAIDAAEALAVEEPGSVSLSVPLGSLSGQVWIDSNGDGVRDSGESGITASGVNTTVKLYANTAPPTLLGERTLDAAASLYTFTDLPPGTYVLEIVPPASHALSPADQGSDDQDSDFDATSRQVTLVLGEGETRTGVDAGLIALSGVSGRVWIDADANGVQDGGDTDYPTSATVQLYHASGQAVGEAVTVGSGGGYTFSDLIPGDYRVQVTVSGYQFSPQNAVIGDDTTDSDIDPASGASDVFSVTSGSVTEHIDAGVYRVGSISGRVWIDTDGDGIRDSGETAFPADATVELRDSLGALYGDNNPRGLDINDGTYSFDAVVPGTYSIRVVLPATPLYAFSPQNAGIGNDSADSDVAPNNGQTGGFTVRSGDTITYVDAGVYAPGSISGTVWIDDNGDGIRDEGETDAPPDTTVKLRDKNGDETEAALDGGSYEFSDLAPGTYTIRVLLPTDRAFQFSPAGDDSDVNSSGEATVTVGHGEQVTGTDAGVYEPGSISGRVWIDSDRDGRLDGDETAYPAGATVELFRDDASIGVIALDTEATGAYQFTTLAPGSYTLVVHLPETSFYRFSPADQGDDSTDSDVSGDGEFTATISSGQQMANVGAGVYGPLPGTGRISGRVWIDSNANGVEEGAETAYPADATVQLYDAQQQAVGSPTTVGAGGAYLLLDVAPGDYTLKVTASGYRFSPQDADAADELTDSDVDPTTGFTDVLTVVADLPTIHIDAGVYLPASISGRVWIDTDADGVQDGDETAFPPDTGIRLTGPSGDVDETPLDDNGAYQFEGLAPGEHTLEVILPATPPYVFSPAGQGDETTDSNVTGEGKTTLSLATGQTVTNVDAGVYEPPPIPGTISGRVWLDANADGVRDGGETDVPAGITVQLWTKAGQLAADTAPGADGAYEFSDIAPGDYSVVVVLPETLCAAFSPQHVGDDASDSDVDGSGQTDTLTLESDGEITQVDAGVYLLAEVSGTVWIDTNRDGLKDGTEGPYLNGTQVELFLMPAQAVGTPVLTDGNGGYRFRNLTPGRYYVRVTLPTGYSFSPQGLDSDVNFFNGVSADAELTPGKTVTFDAGLYVPPTTGNGSSNGSSNGGTTGGGSRNNNDGDPGNRSGGDGSGTGAGEPTPMVPEPTAVAALPDTSVTGPQPQAPQTLTEITPRPMITGLPITITTDDLVKLGLGGLVALGWLFRPLIAQWLRPPSHWLVNLIRALFRLG